MIFSHLYCGTERCYSSLIFSRNFVAENFVVPTAGVQLVGVPGQPTDKVCMTTVTVPANEKQHFNQKCPPKFKIIESHSGPLRFQQPIHEMQT